MKANEAPENIYVALDTMKDDNSTLVLDHPIHYPICTKYTRTDAFIEKACEWIKEHKEEVETEDNGIIGWIPDYFIKDFKKYMEE